MALEDKVKDLIVKELGVDASKVTMDSALIDDLGADSLDTVEIVMSFEDEFDISIPDDDAQKMRTVGDIIAYLKDKVDE